jgi:hypothetical protein
MLRRLVSKRVVTYSTRRITPVRSTVASVVYPSFVFHPNARTLSSLAEPDQSLFDVNRPAVTNNSSSDVDKQLRSDVKSMGLILGTCAAPIRKQLYHTVQ